MDSVAPLASQVVAVLAPFLPHLVTASQRAAEGIGSELHEHGREISRTVWQQLFRALFSADVAEVYHEARASTAPLRLRLLIEDGPAARVPWELLYDPERGEYLAVDATVVRGVAARRRAQPRHIAGPVRVLLLDLLGPRTDRRQLSAASCARELRRLLRLRQLAVTSEAPGSVAALAVSVGTVPSAEAADATDDPSCHVLHLLASAHVDPETGQPLPPLGIFLLDDPGQGGSHIIVFDVEMLDQAT